MKHLLSRSSKVTCVFAFVLLGLILLLITSVYSYSKQDLERLDNTIFQNPQRPGAIFMHDEHNEVSHIEDCAVCHHVYQDKNQSSEDSLCSECHNLKPDNENSISLQVAFHKRCKQCHFDQNKGPVLCGECHIN